MVPSASFLPVLLLSALLYVLSSIVSSLSFCSLFTLFTSSISWIDLQWNFFPFFVCCENCENTFTPDLTMLYWHMVLWTQWPLMWNFFLDSHVLPGLFFTSYRTQWTFFIITSKQHFSETDTVFVYCKDAHIAPQIFSSREHQSCYFYLTLDAVSLRSPTLLPVSFCGSPLPWQQQGRHLTIWRVDPHSDE